MDKKDLKEFEETARIKTEELIDKASEKGKDLKDALLGEDGKFNKEDITRIADGVKKAVLGEDGKFDKDDLNRYAENAAAAGKKLLGKASEVGESFKDSSVGKSLLGEDGKFDKEDAARIASDVKEAGEELLEKAKKLFEK